MKAKGIVVVPPADPTFGSWLEASGTASLQRIANRPIVCHVLDALDAAEVSEAIVVCPTQVAADVGACIDREAPSSLPTSLLVHDYKTGSAPAIDALAGIVGESPVIVHRANGLLSQPLAPLLGLLGEGTPDIVLMVAQGAQNTQRLAPASQRTLRIAELDPAKAGFGVVGVCALGPGALPHLHTVGWSQDGLELETMAERIAEHGGNLHVRTTRAWRDFSGRATDLLDMNRAVLDMLEDQPTPVETDGNRFEGRVLIDPTASVSSSVICGPAIVGARAHVADSYIGPHTSIGEEVHVECAEIERSIVLAGASIQHVGGRVVASVVGRQARIFRDFSVPRAIRLQVGDGDEVALC